MSLLVALIFCCTSNSVGTLDTQSSLDIQVELWSSNPQQFVNNMTVFEPVEQLYIVRKILSNPNAVHNPILCRTMAISHQPYCMEMLGRSHLWDVPITNRAIEGQHTEVKGCVLDDVWCVSVQAVSAAKVYNIPKVQKVCTSIFDTQAREECFFQSAEVISSQERPDALRNALYLCSQISVYRAHCLRHAVERGAATSQSTAVQLTAIDEMVEKDVEELKAYFLTMTALQYPNSSFIPYWDRHSVHTLIFLQGKEKFDKSLDDWVQQYQLEIDSLPKKRVTLSTPMNNYWVEQGKGQIPSKLYLSLETRPFSLDESLDVQLAMLAALIQLQFPLKEVAKDSTHPTIQWMLNRASHKR